MDDNKYIVKHKTGGYQVMIWLDKAHKYIGLYKTIEKAVEERNKALLKYKVEPKYNKNYIDNKELYYELLMSKASGIMSRKLLDMFIKIVKGVNRKFRYNDEDDRQDIVAYSYEVLIKNHRNFDEARYDNPLAYITEIVKRAHAMQWKILQKSRINTISLDYTNEEGDRVFNI